MQGESLFQPQFTNKLLFWTGLLGTEKHHTQSEAITSKPLLAYCRRSRTGVLEEWNSILVTDQTTWLGSENAVDSTCVRTLLTASQPWTTKGRSF